MDRIERPIGFQTRIVKEVSFRLALFCTIPIRALGGRGTPDGAATFVVYKNPRSAQFFPEVNGIIEKVSADIADSQVTPSPPVLGEKIRPTCFAHTPGNRHFRTYN